MADGVVEKRAGTVSDRRRLAREAMVLRAVIHPGVVAIAGTEPGDEGVDRLVLKRVDGRPLSDLVPCPAPVAAGWGAAVATIVADLHDLGWAHCALLPDHVLIDVDGRPVLCGLADATALREADDPDFLVRGDVQATARLVLEAAPDIDRRTSRRLTRWAEGRPRRHLSARTLAQELVRAVPDAHLSPLPATRSEESDAPAPPLLSPEDTASGVSNGRGTIEHTGSDLPAGSAYRTGSALRTGSAFRTGSDVRTGSDLRTGRVLPGRGVPARATDDRRRSWPARLSVLAAVSIMVVGVALATGRFGSPGSGPGAPAAYVLRSAPGETDLTVTGRWGCGPARPAVLDALSGSVWVFDRWPAPRQRVTARFITEVHGATGLGVNVQGASCDRLVVLRAGRPDVELGIGKSA